jgi:hypothetical protein
MNLLPSSNGAVVMRRDRAKVALEAMLPRPELRALAEVPLADEQRRVAARAEQLGQRDLDEGGAAVRLRRALC